MPADFEGGGEPTTYNLLFVCTGNTCRSPMAEAITRRAVDAREWSHVRVASAGTSAAPGAAASEHAVTVAAEHGISLDEHRAHLLAPEFVEWADLILAMSTSHLAVIAGMGGEDRATLLTDFLDGEGTGIPIEDPFGGDADTYRRAFVQIRDAVEGLLSRLEPILSP